MPRTKVAAVKLTDYEGKRVYEAIEKSLGLLGGIDKLIRPRSNVFIKINHLSPPSPPEKAIVTHPEFTGQVIRILQKIGCRITVGDDIQGGGRDGFLVSGYRRVCRETGARLLNLKEAGFRKVDCGGELLKTAYVSSAVLDADFVVNLPKLKTHALTAFTGAVKNMYGVLPAGQRHRLHGEFQTNDSFSRMLVDLYAGRAPRLTIMDGVVAMEGQGPSGGTPRAAGLVLAGADGVAVDAAAAHILGYGAEEVLTTVFARQRGVGAGDLEDIEIVGEDLASLSIRGFRKPTLAVELMRRKMPARIYGFVSRQMVLTPEVRRDRCTACRECIRICPAEAISLESGGAVIDPASCIHCLCCNEVCRDNAIRLKRKPLNGLISAVDALIRKR